MVNLALGGILAGILKNPRLMTFCGIWSVQGICNRTKLHKAFEEAEIIKKEVW